MGFDFNFNFDFEFDKKKAAPANFFDMAEAAGYPRPFPKQDEMRKFMFTAGNTRLILGARRYGKTDYGVILGSCYELLNNPKTSILLITKEVPRGREIVSEVREILERLGAKFKNKSQISLRLEGSHGKEPNLCCLGVRSKGLRGRHPDYIIIEDAITPDDAGEVERRRVANMYNEALKITHNICLVGQPAHKLDLYQTLRDRIPTFYLKYGDIPELDVDLDAERAAGADEFSIQASYFLRILDAETMPFGGIKEVDFMAKTSAMWIDPAREGADYTAIVCGGRYLNDFIATGFCFRKAWSDCFGEIKQIGQMCNSERVIIETNGLGQFPVDILRGQGLACVGYNTTQPKHAKILNAATLKEDIKLSRPVGLSPELTRANQLFIDQVVNYEYNSKHDDGPDALASLIKYIRGL